MQICTKCNTQSSDSARNCVKCGANLNEYSAQAVALKNIRENDRVKNIILAVSADACPACKAKQGSYPKENAPALPTEGCSHPLGCRCYYEPVLEDIYP